jgi:hypothetical protein
MLSLRSLLLTLAALLGTLALPAAAQTTAYAAGQGAMNRIEVGIDVRASVSPRCGFASAGVPSGTINQSEFDRTGLNREFAIKLDCNTPSRIAVTSANGGLAHAETVTGFASRAPYSVELKMVADNGTTAAAACAADALKSGGTCAFAGTADATRGLLLSGPSMGANGSYLKVTAPAYTGTQPLLAGTYSDTLVIAVSIAP